jgi:hypothetical protein
MAMAACKECKRPVSTGAAACPHCGAPDPASGTPEQQAAEETSAQEAVTSDRRFMIGCLSVFIGIPVLVGLLTWAFADDEPDTGSPAEARYYCQEFVRDRLRAPSTAEFSDVSSTGGENTFTVRGQVDAENAFGAPLRNRFTCEVRYDPDDESWNLVNLAGLR